MKLETSSTTRRISDREYMQLNVVESLRETFAVFGYGIKDGLEDIGGNFLIGYKDSLYAMQNNFSLLSIPDYTSIGSGCYHAEAVLYMLYDNEDLHPFQIMQEAIGAAAHFTQSVSQECTVLSTDEEANEEWDKLVEEELSSMVTKEEMEALSKEEIIAKFFPDEYKGQDEEGVQDENVKLLYVFDSGSELSYDKNKEDFFFTLPDGTQMIDHRLYYVLCKDCVKEVADDMEIRYAHNISAEKLSQRIKDYVDEHFDEF